MAKSKKSSFAVLFTVVCVIAIMVTAISLSFVFFINFRIISNGHLEAGTREQITHLRDQVVATIESNTRLLQHAGTSIAALLKQGQGYVPPPNMRRFLDQLSKTDANVSLLFYSSNAVWNQEGGYYINDGWIPPEDWDNTKRPWFINAKNAQGAVAYNDPYIDANTGNLGSTLSMIVYNDNQEDIGVVAVGVWISDMVKLLNNNNLNKEQDIFLVNKEGLFITHPESPNDPAIIMTKNFFTEMKMDRYRNEILSSPSFSKMDEEAFVFSSAIAQTSWILISVIPTSVMFAETNHIMFRLAITSLIILLITSLGTTLITYFMLTLPIRKVKQAADSLAAMDFTVEIIKFRSDEIGEMQRALITIRDSLRQGIGNLHQQYFNRILENGKRLNTVVVEALDAMESITGNMDIVNSNVQTQMESVQSASNSAETIFQQADSFEQTVCSQVDYIARSSAAVEEMVANINAIRSVVAGTGKTTDTLSKSSEIGHKMLLKLMEELKRIEEQSVTLQAANKTIADIAAQTNILAMNAAIEAAHAGETGKGFAVVAGEIRKLAVMSSKESDSISIEIKKMERAINQISAVSGETVGAMDTIFNEIKTMSFSFAAVDNAIEEQSAGGAQMLTALKSVRDMTGQVQEGAGIIHKHTFSIHQDMKKLQQISQEVTNSVSNMRITSRSVASFLSNAKALAYEEMFSKIEETIK
jgi:methyl-accepting chemotaxis protein